MNDQFILDAYLSLFGKREGAMDSTLDEIEQVRKMIRSELLDELSHPRVRKNPSEKYQIGLTRVNESPLDDHWKKVITSIYDEELARLNNSK